MTIQDWSESITAVELSDDPQLSDELGNIIETYAEKPTHVVLNFSAVGFINSSNISKLLRLRKLATAARRRLVLACVSPQVWSVLLVTGLDKVFEFTHDMMTALAGLQMDQSSARKNKP